MHRLFSAAILPDKTAKIETATCSSKTAVARARSTEAPWRRRDEGKGKNNGKNKGNNEGKGKGKGKGKETRAWTNKSWARCGLPRTPRYNQRSH